MDKMDKKTPTRYYDDILNMEYRVSDQDRFSGFRFDNTDARDTRTDDGTGISRRHQ